MEDHLQELRSKQKKLIFLLGEAVYKYCQSEDLSLDFLQEDGQAQQEIEKLVGLLDYIGERIEKVESAVPQSQEIIVEEEEESEEVEDLEEVEEDDADDVEDDAQEDAEEEQELQVIEEPVMEQNTIVEDSADEEDALDEEELEDDEEVDIEEDVEEDVEEDIQEDAKQDEEIAVEAVEIKEDVPDVLIHQKVWPSAPVSAPVKTTSSIESELNRIVENENSSSSLFAKDKVRLDDTLTRLLDTATFKCDADRRLFERSIKQLSLGNEREREVAIGQIAHSTSKDVLHKVYEFAMKDESINVRLAVVKNISRMKDEECEGFFDLGISDPNTKVRRAAIKGLGSHVSVSNCEILAGLLGDRDEHIRGLAVTYLGIYYGRDGVEKAQSAVSDASAYVRISLLEMLSIVKPEGAMTTVKDLLSDKDESVKKAAEKALEKLAPEIKRNKGYGKRKN